MDESNLYEYQKDHRFFAQVTGLMEELCEQELTELGAKNTKIVYRGIEFDADMNTIYRINYNSRLVTRILAPLKVFKCRDTNVLKKIAYTITWEDFLSNEKTFAIAASVSNSNINNSLYALQCLKDGIADYFRDKYGKRPSVETVNPDVRFNLHIEKDMAVISLDTSGESLHKRGYRLLAGEAPMQETLAAALIRISGWNGEKPLTDIMCGSGTILCEALMHYCCIPAQRLRKIFGFANMPEFNKAEWERLKDEYDKQIRPLPKKLISGSDRSNEALKVAKDNLSRLPFHDSVELSCKSFQDIKKFENGLLITNPPYAMRLGKIEEVKELYTNLGDFLKNNCQGTTAYIFTGDPSLRKSIGLKTTRRIPLTNGKLEGVLVQIDSYEGSKKKYYQAYKAEETSNNNIS